MKINRNKKKKKKGRNNKDNEQQKDQQQQLQQIETPVAEKAKGCGFRYGVSRNAPTTVLLSEEGGREGADARKKKNRLDETGRRGKWSEPGPNLSLCHQRLLMTQLPNQGASPLHLLGFRPRPLLPRCLLLLRCTHPGKRVRETISPKRITSVKLIEGRDGRREGPFHAKNKNSLESPF